MKHIKVFKREERFAENFSEEKIINALTQSSMRVVEDISTFEIKRISSIIVDDLKQMIAAENRYTIMVEEIESAACKALLANNRSWYEQYSQYMNYKERFNGSFANIINESKKLIYSGDKENANKNSAINSTQKELLSGLTSKELMLEFELPVAVARSHKEGDIYVHDLSDRLIGSINCCLFDAGNVMRGGFNLNGVQIKEPSSIEAAGSIVCDLVMVASSQQYGGFTIPEIDTVLAPYVKKSFDKERAFFFALGLRGYQLSKTVKATVKNKLNQAIQSLEHKINCVNNALGQTPFFTVSFGKDTSKEARMVSKAILDTRLAKMGDNEMTAIFPKLVFLHREDLNGKVGTLNYDLKKLAIKCSMENLYPDYLSLDAGAVGEAYERCGEVISPMGCRAYLSPWYDENGIERYTGRFNIGAGTLNLPRYAIEADGNIDKFKALIDKNFDIITELHLYTYSKMAKKKASSNPLFFVEGGCAVKLNPEDSIEKALECATASFGYIGLTEACYLLTGKHLHENVGFAEEVLKHLKDKVDKACKDHNKLFALYGTPSEGLCDKFLQMDLKKYGVIEGVTNKEWYTNSHHVDVRARISALEKMDIENILYKYPTGGRIMYTEWPNTDNFEAIETIVNKGMKAGNYLGINFENSTCMDCGAKGDFKHGECLECHSMNVTTIDRVCGYLGISTNNGETRYNNGKKHEVLNRVKHYNQDIN